MFLILFLVPQILGAGILTLQFDCSHDVVLRQDFMGDNFSTSTTIILFPNRLRMAKLPIEDYPEKLDYMVGLYSKFNKKLIGNQIHRRLAIHKSENFTEDVYNVKDARLSIQWRYECDDAFYGPRCETSCNSTIAKIARQRCDEETGQLRCDLGWMGKTCFQVIDARLCDCPTTDFCVASLANSSILECEKRHETHPDICIPSPENPTETHCLNGGKCYSNGPHRFCECPNGFTGENCQNEPEEKISTFFLFFVIFVFSCPILILTTLVYYKNAKLSRFMEDIDLSVSYLPKIGQDTLSISNPYTLEPKIDPSKCVLVDETFMNDKSKCCDVVQELAECESEPLKGSNLFPEEDEDEGYAGIREF